MRSLKLKFPANGGYAKREGNALLLLGIVVLAIVLYEFKATMDEAGYWEMRIANMDQQVQSRATPQILSTHGGRETGRRETGRRETSGPREIKVEVKKANAVMSELDLPWEALFDSLEHAASRDVALLSFQPNAVGRTIRIGGEAKNISAMLDFVGALEREPAVEDAYLLKYEIKRDDPQQPVIFSLTASWI
jgi:hypothetical protein